MRHSCVMFDLDDTLFLESEYVRSGFRAVGAWVQAQFGVARFAETAWELFRSGQRRHTFDAALRTLGLSLAPDVIASMVAIYRNHEPEISLLPDAERCLSELEGVVFTGIISDGPASAQRAKILALGLSARVCRIILTDELGEGSSKPHPRAFELMQGFSGSAPGQCVYVADNPSKDFVAPNGLGWCTVRVVRAGALYAALPSVGDYAAQHTVASLTQALKEGLL